MLSKFVIGAGSPKINRPTGPIYDTDAQAFFTAVQADGSVLTTTQKSGINTLVTDLKTAGLWTKTIALYPFIGGIASTHKWNLKDPRDLDAAYRLVFVGSPVHSSTGVAWNGTTQYANTFLLANTMGQNNVHISYYSRINADLSSLDMGAENGTAWCLRFALNFSNGTYVETNAGGGTVGGLFPSTMGYFMSTRILSTEYNAYRNGSLHATKVDEVRSPEATSIYIGGSNNTGTPRYGSRDCSFSSIGSGLTSTEAANQYTAIQAYQTSLGRQL